eukprot:767209_1
MDHKRTLRVCDYFCIVTGRKTDIASETFIQFRYPKVDFEDAIFPKDIEMFCFPSGVPQPDPEKPPENFPFVLTEISGDRVYCMCRTFCDKDTHGNLVQKSVCLTSHWPFYTQFGFFLSALDENLLEDALKAPIERIIGNFINEVPLPPRGKTTVLCHSLPGVTIKFRRSAPNRLPAADFRMKYLFEALDVGHVLILFCAVLSESRILFISQSCSRLAFCAESIRALIYPFRWRHIYIPVLPEDLVEYVCAPMPYICGVLADYCPEEDVLEGVVIVDLDKGTIRGDPDSKVAPIHDKFGPKLARNLHKELSEDSDRKQKNIQNHFIDFFVKVFRNYQELLKVPKESPGKLTIKKRRDTMSSKSQFDTNDPFISVVIQSQLFQCFIDEGRDVGLTDPSAEEYGDTLFFNECIKELSKPSDFMRSTSFKHQDEYDCLPPDATDLDDWVAPSQESIWPQLDLKLFTEPRKVAPLVQRSAAGGPQTFGGGRLSTDLEYFRTKLMHFRLIRALQQQSDLETIEFNSLTSFLHEFDTSDVLNRRGVVGMRNLLEATVTGRSQTSVTTAWGDVRHQMHDFTRSSIQVSDQLFTQCTSPLLKGMHESSTALEVAFSEMEELTAFISNQKQITEEARNCRIVSKTRSDTAETITAGRGDLRDPHPLALTHSASDYANVKYQILATSFQLMYEFYESKLSESVQTIRSSNERRLRLFQDSMNVFVESQETYLKEQLERLDTVKEALSRVDIPKDMLQFPESLSEKSSSKTRHSSGGIEMRIELPRQSTFDLFEAVGSLPDESVLKKTDLYCTNLWGTEGFPIALRQSQQSRLFIKAIVSILEVTSKQLSTFCSMMKKIRARSDQQSKSVSMHQVREIFSQSLLLYWKRKERIERVFRIFEHVIIRLRVAKNQMKNGEEDLLAVRRSLDSAERLAREDRAKLREKVGPTRKEADDAYNAYVQAVGLSRSIDGNSPSHAPFALLYSSYTSLSSMATDADTRFRLAVERERHAIISREIGAAATLNMLQERQIGFFKQIREIFSFVTEELHDVSTCLLEECNGLNQLFEKLESSHDLDDFKELLCMDEVKKEDPDDKPEILSRHIAIGIGESHDRLAFLRRMNSFVEDLISPGEVLEKISAKIQSLEIDNGAWLGLESIMKSFVETMLVICSPHSVQAKRDVITYTSKFCTEYKQKLASLEKSYEQSEFRYKSAVESMSKAFVNMQKNQQDLERLQAKLNDGKKTKSLFKRERRVSDYMEKVAEASVTVEENKSHLQKEQQRYHESLRGVYDQLRAWVVNSFTVAERLLTVNLEIDSSRFDTSNKKLKELITTAQKMDFREYIADFMAKHKMSGEVPPSVLVYVEQLLQTKKFFNPYVHIFPRSFDRAAEELTVNVDVEKMEDSRISPSASPPHIPFTPSGSSTQSTIEFSSDHPCSSPGSPSTGSGGPPSGLRSPSLPAQSLHHGSILPTSRDFVTPRSPSEYKERSTSFTLNSRSRAQTQQIQSPKTHPPHTRTQTQSILPSKTHPPHTRTQTQQILSTEAHPPHTRTQTQPILSTETHPPPNRTQTQPILSPKAHPPPNRTQIQPVLSPKAHPPPNRTQTQPILSPKAHPPPNRTQIQPVLSPKAHPPPNRTQTQPVLPSKAHPPPKKIDTPSTAKPQPHRVPVRQRPISPGFDSQSSHSRIVEPHSFGGQGVSSLGGRGESLGGQGQSSVRGRKTSLPSRGRPPPAHLGRSNTFTSVSLSSKDISPAKDRSRSIGGNPQDTAHSPADLPAPPVRKRTVSRSSSVRDILGKTEEKEESPRRGTSF